MDEDKKLLEEKQYEKYYEKVKNKYDKDPTPENKTIFDNARKMRESYREYKEFKKKNLEDFYEVLGVGESATQQEIKEKYKLLVMKFHPDRSRISETREIMTVIINAYNTLIDETSRKKYDMERFYRRDGDFSTNESGFRVHRRTGPGFYPTNPLDLSEFFQTERGVYHVIYNTSQYENLFSNIYGRRRRANIRSFRDFNTKEKVQFFLVVFIIILIFLWDCCIL